MKTPIVKDEARLRVPSLPVEFDAKTRKAAHSLVLAASGVNRALGLAAPQIGVRRRMFHYDLSRYPHAGIPTRGVVCNPTVIDSSGSWDREEGCLSFPRKIVVVRRPSAATFEWFTVDGERCEATLSGMAARVWLHETDHLDGILMFDRQADDTRVVVL